MTASRIWTRVDFDRDGKQVDWLYLPHSVTRSAYGNIAIPIAIIRNGPGPTALFLGGNHGDEFEGQIALSRLIREIDPKSISGRIIVMPAVNLPAALASTRVSPIDGVNLNRSFPGDANGTPTEAIAHWLNAVLYPMADFIHDFHAGGSSLKYLHYGSIRRSGDEALDRRALEALGAFNPPIGMVWGFSPDEGLSHVAALRLGKVTLGGEFGGGGTVSRQGIALIEAGIARELAWLGMAAPPPPAAETAPTRLMEIRGMDYYSLATDAGVFEPAVALGQSVAAGDVSGWIHFVDDPARPPATCHFGTAGMVVCIRHFGRCERGDCVAHLASDIA